MTDVLDVPASAPAAGARRRGWWVGWYMPTELAPTFEGHFPWWESGYAPDEHSNFTIGTMVGAVLADSADAAKAFVVASFDVPPEVEWRWEPEPIARSPFSDRFPQAEWMAWDPEAGVSCQCDLPTCNGGAR